MNAFSQYSDKGAKSLQLPSSNSPDRVPTITETLLTLFEFTDKMAIDMIRTTLNSIESNFAFSPPSRANYSMIPLQMVQGRAHGHIYHFFETKSSILLFGQTELSDSVPPKFSQRLIL